MMSFLYEFWKDKNGKVRKILGNRLFCNIKYSRKL